MLSVVQIAARRRVLSINSVVKGLSTIKCARNISVSHLDPSIRNFASALAERQPCFALPSKSVKVLSEPTEFYQTLLGIIKRAKRRIFLSSLYIGASEKELIDALDASLRSNPELHVYLTLDFNRSTRPGPSSPILALLPLLRDHRDRVHISLFRSPKLSGVMDRVVPPRFNEGWGTWHAKIYGSDAEVMISGANLNESYFTDRQDRYIHFTTQPNLAEYCFQFLRLVSGFSYQVTLPADSDIHDYRWPDPSVDSWKIQSKAEEALIRFQAANLASTMLSSSWSVGDNPDHDVLVLPVIQAGQLNIREEEHTLSLLFDHLSRERQPGFNPTMDLTSGYFGLYKPYQDMVLKSTVRCGIIAASPKANGFYGSRGISGLIPEGYTYLEQRFMRAVKAASRESPVDNPEGSGVELKEWEREGWTYHAKGIWLSPRPGAHPALTLFGSTNLNSRSAHLDTELSFVMMTSSDLLRRRLHEEVQGLRRWAVPWRGDERRVRRRTKAIVGVVGGML
ncbi:hypothetical protein BJ138DRAFT_1080455 [Hygrophoropsis aurantiaca]|uniref:Uncharacterized protein n=1 Tax=Hygrophoropsis aurantiaca TaxID=72124 RepID=A0ACB8ALA9_9AGAM|nr:hypothetical protein BJ138DRAFT_1080455 [Hygrophoropsis aurantiaca]